MQSKKKSAFDEFDLKVEAMDCGELAMDKNMHTDKTGFIHIVGMNSLQNVLLLSFLKEKNNLMGRCAQNLRSIRPLSEKESILSQLLFIDCKNVDMKDCWSNIFEWKGTVSSKKFVAFYNVAPELEIEKTFLKKKIQGLFYKNDLPDIIAKGVYAIFSGELWYSRNILKKIIKGSNFSFDMPDYATSSNLTTRERELLTLVALGLSNKTIADRLCVSIHTVKNHLYNIYKKTKVSNRFQAALWAAKYINK